MSTPFPHLTPGRWFRWIISILGVLGTVYLLLHIILPPGRSKTKLTTPDVAIISSLLYDEAVSMRPQSTSGLSSSAVAVTRADSAPQNKLGTKPAIGSAISTIPPDGQKPLTSPQRRRVLRYIASTYDLVDQDTLHVQEWIGLFRLPADLIRSLSDYVFPVRSYFWLYDGGLYAEVMFWTWFGLIASLLYSTSEALRKGTTAFDKNEVWIHIAKFFYAPLCSVVIFLGLSLAFSDKSVIARIDYSPNQILVAFIMGFFSGRLVQFLQSIKNLIFPGDNPNPANPPGSQTGLGGSPTSPGGPTPDDIRLAIEQQGDRWRLMYPNVSGIALQTKVTNGQPTGLLSALFEVRRKLPDLTVGQLPAVLPFVMPDGRQVAIPTDVVEVGTTQLAYSVGTPIHLSIPVSLGASVRRQNLTEWGTLGLRLRDSQFDYVLSCYHVLCADLLATGTWSFDASPGSGKAVVVPGMGGVPGQIGEVVAGRFSQTEDFALVRLTDPNAVTNLPTGMSVPFFDAIDEPGNSLVGRMAYMVGACSNYQQGKILAPYQEGEYEVPGLPVKTMKGLIKTERLADAGDSGSAVFIQDNGRNRVVGLLVGFNQTASYVLPISNFCLAFHVDLP